MRLTIHNPLMCHTQLLNALSAWSLASHLVHILVMAALLSLDMPTFHVHSSFALPWYLARCGTTFEALLLPIRHHQEELHTFMDHPRDNLF